MGRSVKIDHKMGKGNPMPTEYVQKQQGVYRIKGTRVSLGCDQRYLGGALLLP
jgi:hypothetical protein